ncbi:MAG: hypothetical protein Q4D04_15725 [Clostridia bacterium]|nr:hypothetical protein [Clostridia bacterium]
MAQFVQRHSPCVKLDGEIVWWRGLLRNHHRRRAVTKQRLGNTLYIVTAECAPDAMETVEKKLEKLLFRRILDAKSYPADIDASLASRFDTSEYRVG